MIYDRQQQNGLEGKVKSYKDLQRFLNIKSSGDEFTIHGCEMSKSKRLLLDEKNNIVKVHSFSF